MPTLAFTEDEQKRLQEWDEEHLKSHHGGREPYGGAIGGRITYSVTYTGLGIVFKVKCGSCVASDKPKEVYEKDLSDYNSW